MAKKKEPIIKVYPGLDLVAGQIADMTCFAINRLSNAANNKTEDGKHEMPYRAQFILEQVIKILEARV